MLSGVFRFSGTVTIIPSTHRAAAKNMTPRYPHTWAIRPPRNGPIALHKFSVDWKIPPAVPFSSPLRITMSSGEEKGRKQKRDPVDGAHQPDLQVGRA